MANNKVMRSIEAPGGLACVDLIRDADGRWRYAEYRRDPEDPHGWRPTGRETGLALDSLDAAMSAARRDIDWLAMVGQEPDRD